MTCCNNIKEVKGICENCCSIIETLSIEEPELSLYSSPSVRKRKFINFLLSKRISSMCLQTLEDFFPRIESSFMKSDRTNFVNMNHLVRVILPFYWL